MWSARQGLCAALGALVISTVAVAHGVPQPKHGGIVDVGGEMSLELVREGAQSVVYVEDHGKPVDTRSAVAEVLLHSETGRSIGTLKAGGANRLIGRLPALRKGDRLFVRVTFGNGSIEVGEILIP